MGSIIEAGNFKIYMPDGYAVTTGSNTGDPDDNQVWFHTNPVSFTDYFWVIKKDRESDLDMSLSMTKDMNNGEDIEPFNVGDSTWSGITYMFHDIPCNSLKGLVKGNLIQLNVIGRKIDDEEVRKVMESIEMK